MPLRYALFIMHNEIFTILPYALWEAKKLRLWNLSVNSPSKEDLPQMTPGPDEPEGPGGETAAPGNRHSDLESPECDRGQRVIETNVHVELQGQAAIEATRTS